ncbi:unnamed protein product [Caenorhabditis nigoni]|uniref:Uncharacterized protein n=1 Tax=Caenorhabditis nigoni TaxID=1611254 RepID=A0A2G5T371_9PELO|nr:hypothetical protein B9Z55_026343 [Caenorhabditis nigoni]
MVDAADANTTSSSEKQIPGTDIGLIKDNSAFASHFRATEYSPNIYSDENVFDDLMQRVSCMGGNYGNGSENKGSVGDAKKLEKDDNNMFKK